jgi:hypothetical protein
MQEAGNRQEVSINGVKVPSVLLAAKSVTLRPGRRKTLSMKLPKGVSRIANRTDHAAERAGRSPRSARRGSAPQYSW